MDQEIASATNKVFVQKKATALVQIMNTNENMPRNITAIPHHSPLAAIPPTFNKAISNAGHKVDQKVINVEQYESWEMFTVHAVPVVSNMHSGTEGLQKMRNEIHDENEGVVISIQLRWMVNPRRIRDRI